MPRFIELTMSNGLHVLVNVESIRTVNSHLGYGETEIHFCEDKRRLVVKEHYELVKEMFKVNGRLTEINQHEQR